MGESETSEPEFLKCPCKECGNNIEYPATSARQTIACPHCGEWTELASPKTVRPRPEPAAKKGSGISLAKISIALWVLLVAGLAVWYVRFQHAHPNHEAEKLAATNQVAKALAKPKPAVTNIVIIPSNNVVAQVDSTPRPKSPDDLKVTFLELQKTPGTGLAYAIGTLQNDSAYQRFGVKIELDLVDARGNDLGKTHDYKDVIEPHKSWRFRALIPEAKAVSAKISSIKEQD